MKFIQRIDPNNFDGIEVDSKLLCSVKSKKEVANYVNNPSNPVSIFVDLDNNNHLLKRFNESYLKVTYNITEIGKTMVLPYHSSTRYFKGIDYITKVIVDGVESQLVDTFYYNFETIGEHTIEYYLDRNCNDYSCLFYNNFNDVDTIISADTSFIEMTESTNCEFMFSKCHSLSQLNVSHFNTSNCISIKAMFQGLYNITELNVTNWDVSQVRDMQGVFLNCTGLTQIGDISNWNVSNVTTMQSMFNSGTSLEYISDLSNWDVSHVENMSILFADCQNLRTLGNLNNWNTSACTNMSGMFLNCYNLNSLGDLSNWDVSQVTTMDVMFGTCSGITSLGNLNNWNTSNCINMYAMFANDFNLESIGDLSNWNTSACTDMSYMFNACFNLESIGDLSNWNVSNVTDMSGMLSWTYKIKQINVSNWDTRNLTSLSHFIGADATTMRELGYSANSFDYETIIVGYENWNTSAVTNMSYMFQGMNNMESWDISNWDLSSVGFDEDDNTSLLGGMFSIKVENKTPKCKFIKLPNMTIVANQMFSNQVSLEYIDFSKCEQVPLLESKGALSNIPSSCELRVPSNLLDEWKNADVWKTVTLTFVGV